MMDRFLNVLRYGLIVAATVAIGAVASATASDAAAPNAAERALELPVLSDFDNDPVDRPPTLFGANHPTLLTVPPFTSVLVRDQSLGITTRPVELDDGGTGSYVSVGYGVGPLSRGSLRIEATVSVDHFANAYFLQTVSSLSAVVSRMWLRTNGRVTSASLGGVTIGRYQPGRPFRVRMDVDMDLRRWWASVDDELNGFADDEVSPYFPFVNGPGAAPNLAWVGTDLNVTDATRTLIAYDDVAIDLRRLGLAFPLRGTRPGLDEDLGAENAPIDAVLDHFMGDDPDDAGVLSVYGCDGQVQAYNGEFGNFARSPFAFGGCNRGYSLEGSQAGFAINGSYLGFGAPEYLHWDGHPGYDFRAGPGTEIYAAVDGVIRYVSAVPSPGTASAHERGPLLELLPDDFKDHRVRYFPVVAPGPAAPRFTLGDDRPGCPAVVELPLIDGTRVSRGCLIGVVADADWLHFEVRRRLDAALLPQNAAAGAECRGEAGFACVPVDPYGAEGSLLDSLAIRTGLLGIPHWAE